jgi:hypothetical protein
MAESEAGAGQEEVVRTRTGALIPTSWMGREAAGSREKGQLQISDPLEHTSHQAQDMHSPRSKAADSHNIIGIQMPQ